MQSEEVIFDTLYGYSIQSKLNQNALVAWPEVVAYFYYFNCINNYIRTG